MEDEDFRHGRRVRVFGRVVTPGAMVAIDAVVCAPIVFLIFFVLFWLFGVELVGPGQPE